VSELASAWDPAPTILVGAGVALTLFGRGFVRLRRRGRADHAGWSRPVLFLLALVLATLALVSPLDEIAESDLLSAHMLQHVLIGDVAPALALVALRGPLLFCQLPRSVLRPLVRLRVLRRVLAFLLRPSVSFAAWIAATGVWYVPACYDYALSHQVVHDLEHLSLMLAGLLVWTQIVDPARRDQLTVSQRFGYMLALAGAGTVLAVTFALAPAPVYPAYADDGERLLGIGSSRDQQLAGLVMVVEQLAMLAVCARFMLRSRVESLVASRAQLVPARRHA
jgi:putative membrane protein